MRIYIRTAQPSDRETILKFTERTWEWGDYIPDVWDTWLSEPRGRLLVATVKRVPVGIEHIIMVSGDEAWLEGLRVDPAYRRRGIAMKLTERCVDEARVFGANVVRFQTSSLNTPVHEIAAALGFTRVAVIQPMTALALSENNKTIVRAGEKELPELIRFIQKAASLKSAAGLYSVGWRFCKLTPEEISQKLNEGAIRLIDNGNTIEAASIIEKRGDGSALVISYAGGDKDALTQLALGIRSEAAASGLTEVSTRLPSAPEIESAFARAGYQKSDELPFWVFAKNQFR